MFCVGLVLLFGYFMVLCLGYFTGDLGCYLTAFAYLGCWFLLIGVWVLIWLFTLDGWVTCCVRVCLLI